MRGKRLTREMDEKEDYDRHEKDKSDFLAFLRSASAKQRCPKSKGEKLRPERKSKEKKFPENNIPTICKECTFMSRNPSFLADHKQNGHRANFAKIASFSCSNCDFASFGRTGLATHVSVKHELEDA